MDPSLARNCYLAQFLLAPETPWLTLRAGREKNNLGSDQDYGTIIHGCGTTEQLSVTLRGGGRPGRTLRKEEQRMAERGPPRGHLSTTGRL